MAVKQKGAGDWGWPVIILLFILGIWPVALLALFAKLFAGDVEQREQAAPPLQWDQNSRQGRAFSQQSRQAAQRTAQRAARKARSGSQVVRQMVKSPVTKKSNARLLMLIGAVLMFGGLFAASDAIELALFYTSRLSWWLPDILRPAAVAAAGGAMFCKGLFMNRALKRYSKYLLVMGDQEAISTEEIARTLGYSRRRVEKDLQKMIDKGYFGGKAYLNVELGYLFRSSQADAEWKRKQEEAVRAAQDAQTPQVPKEAEEGYSGILRNIRRANERIADPVLSAKIYRLEEITAKIFKAVEEDPKKAERIGTFLNYYLPTTQKLLNSYAQFESAGVEGENLSQAKQRIETTMDSIVAGFEHQLDELYKADALDVDTDIRVMEHMLRRDTGTTAQDFGLEEEPQQRDF